MAHAASLLENVCFLEVILATRLWGSAKQFSYSVCVRLSLADITQSMYVRMYIQYVLYVLYAIIFHHKRLPSINV